MPFLESQNVEYARASNAPTVDPVQATDGPDAGEVWSAAFRRENVVGSALSQEFMPNTGYANLDPSFNPIAPENLQGFEQYADQFAFVNNREESEALKRQIARERQDIDTLSRAGGAGVAAQFVAGTLDPTIFIPVGGTIKKGDSLLRVAGKSAYGALAGAAVSETVLHATQRTRTAEESAVALAGASVLGGLLGPGIVGGFRAATGKPVFGFDADELAATGERLEAEMYYSPDEDPQFVPEQMDRNAMQAGSLSAASVREPSADDYTLAASMKTADMSAAMQINPLLRLSSADSVKAREAANMLMENGMFLDRNREGLASPLSVEQRLTEYRGWHAEAERGAMEAFRANKATAGLTHRQFLEEVSYALRRGDKHDVPEVEQAAKAYRAAIERTKERAIEANLLPEDVDVKTADSYFHRMWKREALSRRPDEFKGMVRSWLGDMFESMRLRAMKIREDLTRLDAKPSEEDAEILRQWDEIDRIAADEGGFDAYGQTIADDLLDRLTGMDIRTMPHNLVIGQRGPLAERTFNIPDLFEANGVRVEEFLENDAQAVMERYMRVMSADIELANAFGRPDMQDTLRDVAREYDELIAKAETEAEKKRLSDQKRNRIKDLEGVRDVIRGNYGTPTYENMWRRGAAVVRTWNYMTMLGGMTVSAFPDIANKVLGHGFLGVTRDLIAPLITNMKAVKMSAREARQLGIAVERSLATRIASLADIGDIYGRGTRFERAVSGVSNNFTTWTGMRLWNDVMKQADYLLGTSRAVRIMERPERAKPNDIAWLANLGIGEADYKRIMTQVRKFGQSEGGMRLTNAEKWEDAEARRIWIAAMGKNANIQTVTPGAGDKMLVMNGDLGKTIAQFKTFAFAANQRVTIRAAQQARMGDGRVASFLLTAMTMGMLVYAAKSWLSGRDTSDDPATWIREGVDRSGMATLFMEGFNTAEKITGKTFIGDSPASRYASRGKVASMLGPSLGRAEDAVGLISRYMDGDLKDRDIHAVRKLLPYNNLFYVRKVFDWLEEGAVEATRAEETSFSEDRD